MAALSSMIRTRRLAVVCGLDMRGLRRAAGQFEHEGGAAAGSVALHAQRAAELLRRERAAVQAEAVPGGARGEAMAEQPRHVLRRDADAVVDDADAHAAFGRLDAQG